MNPSTIKNTVRNTWEQSLCLAWGRSLAGVWRSSTLAGFLLGPGYHAHKNGFRQTAVYRAVAAPLEALTALLHTFGERIKGSVSARLLEGVAGQSYLVLVLVAAYPIIDYLLRSHPALAGSAGIWKELLFLLGLLPVLARLAVNRREKLNFTPLDIPLLVFFGTGVMLYLFRSPEPAVALDGFRVTFEYILWYFVAANLILNFRKQRIFALSLIVAAFPVALYGIYQYVTGAPMPASWVDQAEAGVRTRAFSIIGSPNILGCYLVLVIPIAAALLRSAGSRRLRYLLGAAILVMLACLVFTFSRGAWLAFLVAALLYGLLQDRRVLALILAGAILLPVVSPSVAGRLQYTFSSHYLESSARGGRLARWELAIDRLAKHPVTGVGLGRFGGATADRYRMPGTFYVDNYYLKLAVETGLTGLGVFLWVVLHSLRLLAGAIREVSSDPEKRALACGIAAGLVGVLVHNGVENIFEVPMMQTLFWAILGAVAQLPERVRDG